MKILRKITVPLVIALLAVPASLVALVYFSGSDTCGNYIHEEYYSPNNSHKAVIFQRDCGATTGFSTQVSVIGANEALGNAAGNVYIIEGHPENVAPKISWKNEEALVIHRPIIGAEFKATTKVGWFKPILVEYLGGSS